MSLEPGGIIAWILVGLIAGWLAGAAMKSERGVIGDIIVGLIGALIGGFVFTALGIGGSSGFIGSVVVATIGAILLIVVMRALSGRTA